MNFQESNVSGTVYQRSYKIVIDNALDVIPSIHFNQEQIANLTDGERFQKLINPVSETLTEANASEVFQLVHPVTQESLGEATYAQFQLMLYSLYIHVAQKPAPSPMLPEAVAPIAVT